MRIAQRFNAGTLVHSRILAPAGRLKLSRPAGTSAIYSLRHPPR
jgi:hypothetical protein